MQKNNTNKDTCFLQMINNQYYTILKSEAVALIKIKEDVA